MTMTRECGIPFHFGGLTLPLKQRDQFWKFHSEERSTLLLFGIIAMPVLSKEMGHYVITLIGRSEKSKILRELLGANCPLGM
jgi:hypothetical protein